MGKKIEFRKCFLLIKFELKLEYNYLVLSVNYYKIFAKNGNVKEMEILNIKLMIIFMINRQVEFHNLFYFIYYY